MKIFDLLFELVRLHVPIKQDDWARMKDEMEQDTREWHVGDSNKLKAAYAKYNSKWWVNLGVAISFIPLTRSIAKFMNPTSIEDENED